MFIYFFLTMDLFDAIELPPYEFLFCLCPNEINIYVLILENSFFYMAQTSQQIIHIYFNFIVQIFYLFF